MNFGFQRRDEKTLNVSCTCVFRGNVVANKHPIKTESVEWTQNLNFRYRNVSEINRVSLNIFITHK